MNPKCTLVHCNDGVGPTGTFIAISQLIDKIHSNAQKLNVYQTVLDLRKERKYMVRNINYCSFHWISWWLKTLCKLKFLLAFHFKKRTGKVVVFSFQNEMTTKGFTKLCSKSEVTIITIKTIHTIDFVFLYYFFFQVTKMEQYRFLYFAVSQYIKIIEEGNND